MGSPIYWWFSNLKKERKVFLVNEKREERVESAETLINHKTHERAQNTLHIVDWTLIIEIRQDSGPKSK